MPKAKNTSKKKVEDNGAGFRLSGFLIIVLFASFGLVWLWLQLPKRSEQPAPRPPVVRPSETTNPAKISCNESGGTWIDCGLPAGCKLGEPCDQVCVPQCLAKPAPAPAPVPQPEPTTPVRARPADSICDVRNFICVDGSTSGTLLASPYIVKGTGIAFENTINYILSDADGEILGEGFVTANAPDVGQAGDFEIRDFILRVPRTPNGTLTVFEYSAQDGKQVHIVQIPVRFSTEKMSVKVYLLAPGGAEGSGTQFNTACDSVEATTGVVMKSSLPIETTLRYLLSDTGLREGPYQTMAIPPNTKLVSLKVSAGTATVVLSSELGNYGGGSCNVAAIRAQIEQTLKQFSSVRNVVISQEGKAPEESLQP